MNCPMCGAPLGDGDQMCANCGTKRSEMGPAYNSPARPVQQNSYGGNYGAAGSGGNVGSYGNTGYNGGNNANYGNTSSYNGGMGYSSAGAAQGGTSALGGVGGFMNAWHRNRTRQRLFSLVIVIVFAIIGGVGNLISNRENTQDLGAFSITFPQRMKNDNSSAFVDPSEDGVVYSGRNVGFAYMEYDLSEFGLEGSDVVGLEDEFLEDLETEFEKGLSGYRLKDKMNGYLRFYFTDSGTKYFAAVTVEIHGDSLYMFVANCEEKDQGKYVRKIMDMLGSIKFD